ncbi:MAG: DUF2330 domain-containing protein [Polyangiaceae bacterium]
MRRRSSYLRLVPVAALVSLLSSGRAHACGGLVTQDAAVVTQSQQRVFISFKNDGSSAVVVQLAIPEASAPFGALTPVAALPTLDAEPVDVAELDDLDVATRPVLRDASSSSSSDSGGCGCGSDSAGADLAGGSNGGRGVNIVEVVDIGPVTAAVLSATDTAPLTQWLGDNGFVVPTAETATIDAYVGADKYFIAFKRSAQGAAGPSSVGVSFSVPGDQRGYPLRMSRIGAASRLGIQVFVAAPESVAPRGSAPASPFAALTLKDLELTRVTDDYTAAVADAVKQNGNKAFLIEGVYKPENAWRETLGTKLRAMTDDQQVLTRLTSVVDPTALDTDASFWADAPDDVPKVVTVGSLVTFPGRGGERIRWQQQLLLAFALVGWAARRRSRRTVAQVA